MQVGWVKIDEYLETVQHRRMVSSKVAPCVPCGGASDRQAAAPAHAAFKCTLACGGDMIFLATPGSRRENVYLSFSMIHTAAACRAHRGGVPPPRRHAGARRAD